MANWPANGETDWNTKMKANIDVGHDSDGTHKKSQMLADMGWSPTSYVGGESVTFPNGLIEKTGNDLTGGSPVTITFGTAFPTACVVAVATPSADNANTGVSITAKSTTTLTVRNNGAAAGFRWIARGY